MALIARLISEVTGSDTDDCVRRLEAEYRTPGSTVADEVRRRGIEPYAHSEAMDAFYSESDAFLYESAVWNRNRLKSRMRRWMRPRLDTFRRSIAREALEILVIGDGPGFDSLELARAGNNVTYHELPGFQESFARRLFEFYNEPVKIITDRGNIPKEAFDAVVCLDMLEHVTDPPAVVHALTQYLRSGGLFFSHAPFYMIHPAYPTHLRSNRCFSGSLTLYRDAGLRLLDGEIGWNPLLFAKEPVNKAHASLAAPAHRMIAIQLAGLYLALGRWTALPLSPVHRLRIARGRWFE